MTLSDGILMKRRKFIWLPAYGNEILMRCNNIPRLYNPLNYNLVKSCKTNTKKGCVGAQQGLLIQERYFTAVTSSKINIDKWTEYTILIFNIGEPRADEYILLSHSRAREIHPEVQR